MCCVTEQLNATSSTVLYKYLSYHAPSRLIPVHDAYRGWHDCRIYCDISRGACNQNRPPVQCGVSSLFRLTHPCRLLADPTVTVYTRLPRSVPRLRGLVSCASEETSFAYVGDGFIARFHFVPYVKEHSTSRTVIATMNGTTLG